MEPLPRSWHPEAQILVGGRDLGRAEDAAASAGGRVVRLDADRPRLGLPAGLEVAAIVMLVPDRGSHGQELAAELGVPYLSIGDGLVEIGPTAPVVFAGHWSAGACSWLVRPRRGWTMCGPCAWAPCSTSRIRPVRSTWRTWSAWAI